MTNPAGNVRLNTVGGVRKRSSGDQTRAAKQEGGPFGINHTCTVHLIDYYVGVNDRPRCPMCALEQKYDEARAQLIARENELEKATKELGRLRIATNVQTAVTEAIGALDDSDYGWLKVQMYQYKIDKSVSLKPTHGKLAAGKRLKRGENLPPNGFMALPKKGDPEAHLATSLGGLAMAEYLDEAITCFGSAQAMGIFLKAWWRVLPGGAA